MLLLVLRKVVVIGEALSVCTRVGKDDVRELGELTSQLIKVTSWHYTFFNDVSPTRALDGDRIRLFSSPMLFAITLAPWTVSL